jgi:hypothetical protein
MPVQNIEERQPMTNVGQRDKYERWKPEGFEDYLTMAELCRIVNRDRSRIVQLEREGVIPSPVRVKVGRLKVRLYSMDEVRAIEEWFRDSRPGPRANRK